MEPVVFTCSTCGESRNSKRALKRHIQYHRRVEITGLPDDRIIVHGDQSPVAQVPSDEVAESGIETGRPFCETTVVADGAEAPTIAAERVQPTQRMRRQIDDIVLRLKQRHLLDRTCLSTSTQQLVNELQETSRTGSLPQEVFVGIVVAAKHFAGTWTPRQAVVSARCPKPSYNTSADAIAVKRKLFEDAAVQSSDTAVSPKRIRVLATSPSANVGTDVDHGSAFVMTSVTTSADPASRVESDDEQWRWDIWKCYGTMEVLPPDQMGYAWSPSVALGTDSPPAVMSPMSTWSAESDNEYWGPASPGIQLQQHVRKRHPCRTRRSEYSQQLNYLKNLHPITVDWDQGIWRKASFSDIRLPEQPFFEKELLRVRRIMLKKKALPQGCRIQPSRAAKRRQSPVSTTANVADTKIPSKDKVCRKTVDQPLHSASPEICLVAPEDEF